MDASTLIENMTAGGRSPRELLEEITGEDPVTHPAFAWSNDLACEDCGIHDSTAVIIVPDDVGESTTVRVCFHCAVDHV